LEVALTLLTDRIDVRESDLHTLQCQSRAVDTILQLALPSCERVRQVILFTTMPFSDWAFPEVQNPWLSVEDAQDVEDQQERGRLESEPSLSLHIIWASRHSLSMDSRAFWRSFLPAFRHIKPPSKEMRSLLFPLSED